MAKQTARIEIRTAQERIELINKRIAELDMSRTAYIVNLIDADLNDGKKIIYTKENGKLMREASETVYKLTKAVESLEGEEHKDLRRLATQAEKGMVDLWRSLN